ncbi:pentapeptide repeat-containing protein [Halorubrum trapanicum]|uniref:pentapeptide repeat-containing protein n=1 Tax=Halorubrum trapanicum TaxID=29284 RepID=UPI003C6EF7E5
MSSQTCDYVVRKSDPETWHGNEPSDFHLDRKPTYGGLGITEWHCPHPPVSQNNNSDGDDDQYCVFHTKPGELPDDTDESEALLDALEEHTNGIENDRLEHRGQFIGATFGAIDLTNEEIVATRQHDIRFDHAQFQINNDKLIFKNTTFVTEGQHPISFVGAEFTTAGSGDLVFNNATFRTEGKGDVRFDNTLFQAEGEVQFYRTSFQADGEGHVRFKGATFQTCSGEDVLFQYATFQTDEGYVRFDDATFRADNEGELLFHNTTFRAGGEGEVSFDNTLFRTKGRGFVRFDKATFQTEDQGSLAFGNTTFRADGDGEVRFYDATFHSDGIGDVWFADGTFCTNGKNDVQFQYATFRTEGEGDVRFDDTTFRAIGEGDVQFSGASFQTNGEGDVRFVDTTFKNDGEGKVLFRGDLFKSDGAGEVLFSEARLVDVDFQGVELFEVDFHDANLTGADIREAYVADISVNGSTTCTRLAEKSEFGPENWDATAQSYNRLKTVFSKHGLVGKARDMHTRERRARRLETKNANGLLNRDYIGGLSSAAFTGYGVRPSRLSFWMVSFLIILPTGVYLHTGLEDGFVRTLSYSVVTFTTTPPFRPDGLLGFVVMFQALLGTLSLITLGYIFSNRERF